MACPFSVGPRAEQPAFGAVRRRVANRRALRLCTPTTLDSRSGSSTTSSTCTCCSACGRRRLIGRPHRFLRSFRRPAAFPCRQAWRSVDSSRRAGPTGKAARVPPAAPCRTMLLPSGQREVEMRALFFGVGLFMVSSCGSSERERRAAFRIVDISRFPVLTAPREGFARRVSPSKSRRAVRLYPVAQRKAG